MVKCPIRVLLAEDQALLRAGFRALLESDPEIEVIGEAADGEEAVALALASAPDVVLMDVRMPRVDGLAATARITGAAQLEHTKVLVLTTFEVDEYVFGALRAGASGFLLKDIDPQALTDAVRVVHEGQALLAPRVTGALIEAFVSRDSAIPRTATHVTGIDRLTGREREILALVGVGKSNHEIAEDLVLSPLTAKTHVSRIMSKLNARDRAQLVVRAFEAGLVKTGGT